MRVRNKIKARMNNNVNPLQIKKGHTVITLTDIHTGKKEVYHDDNMQTNAINQMLANCGWLNRDNLTQNNLIVQLIGGVLLTDQEITEDADVTDLPNGTTMIANASHGYSNGSATGDPTEMGSFNANESGWEGNSYIMQFDWTASQGNSNLPIKSVCATGQQWGYAGAGNAQSGLRRSTQMNPSLSGIYTEYRITGYPCRMSLDDSSVYGIDFSDLSNGKITIRKFRLPLTKVNLRNSPTIPIVLSEVEINAPTHLTSATLGDVRDTGSKLMITSLNTTGSTAKWGTNYTQYLFEIDPVAETAVESELNNTSGVDLYGITDPVWMGNDCVAFTHGYSIGSNSGRYASKIYSMKRENGTWGNIQVCDAPFGSDFSTNTNAGWSKAVKTQGRRAVVYCVKYQSGYQYQDVMFDFDLNACWLLNSNSQIQNVDRAETFDAPMICYERIYDTTTSMFRILVKRHQACIATINNLASPVTKTPDKSMTLQYIFDFTEQEDGEQYFGGVDNG